jgi:hypothetical protein
VRVGEAGKCNVIEFEMTEDQKLEELTNALEPFDDLA